MQFFLYEIAARLFGLYLAVDCLRTLRAGYADRKIRSFYHSSTILDWMIDVWLPRPVYERDTSPVRYWMEMSGQAFVFLCCVVMVIFGWVSAST
jgi:hypothetical protein